MATKTERNYGVSLLRVLGMLAIVLCHVSGWLGIAMLEQLFASGVYVFLLISGYLYGRKDIPHPGAWFVSRLKRLLIPYYLFVIPVILFYVFFPGEQTITWWHCIVYLLCLQGLPFLTDMVSIPEIPSLGNIWFLTVILMCYGLTILIKYIEKRHPAKKQVVIPLLVAAWLIPTLVQYFSLPYVSLFYFVTFFIGYYLSYFQTRLNATSHHILYGWVLLILSVLSRLAGKRFLDGSRDGLYSAVVVLSQIGMAVASLFIVCYLTDRSSILQRLAQSRLWSFCDRYSYIIYITHYAFLTGITSVNRFGFGRPVSLLLFLGMVAAATALVALAEHGLSRCRLFGKKQPS